MTDSIFRFSQISIVYVNKRIVLDKYCQRGCIEKGRKDQKTNSMHQWCNNIRKNNSIVIHMHRWNVCLIQLYWSFQGGTKKNTFWIIKFVNNRSLVLLRSKIWSVLNYSIIFFYLKTDVTSFHILFFIKDRKQESTKNIMGWIHQKVMLDNGLI